MSSTESRERMARRRAASLGLKLRRCANSFRLIDSSTGDPVMTAALAGIEAYLGEHYRVRTPGPDAASIPPAWRALIDDYCLHLAAGGQSPKTIRLRRLSLAQIARGLNAAPEKVTGDHLVSWFGRQTHWTPSTRRSVRSTARGFFAWAYRAGRVPDYLGDHLPAVRMPPAVPKPVPDKVWADALAAAEPRTALAMRLAAEAGLRRAEVAQVHTRDLLDSPQGAQLVVHGKGGRTRILPITDSLANEIRRGAAGHTPGAPAAGWLFPASVGGHLTAEHVGGLVGRVLPAGWSMHKLRHRFATRAYRGSRNLRAVQTLLGHASIATTERYTAVNDEEVRAAMMAATDDDLRPT